jgi:predicted RNase H-like nuclease
VILIGLDLAWSSANPSAAVALAWDGRRARPSLWADRLFSDAEILQFLGKAAPAGPALLAVDAPLLVPNESGTRPCDRELSRFYRKAKAMAYPANRRRVTRGEELVSALARLGFSHRPWVEAQKPARQVVEVFPHPAMVELFGLPEILRYKARPGRSLEFRWQELSRYQELLRSLKKSEPAMEAEEILSLAAPGLRGKSLKALEDLLDALFCAYIALHVWYWGPRGYRLFGDEKSGYILVPLRPS